MDLYAFFQSEVKPTIGCTEPGATAPGSVQPMVGFTSL